MPFPIFSLTFGFTSICNTDIIKIFNNLSQRPGSFDYYISGPNLYFLLISIFIYWILVISFEHRLFENMISKNGSNFLDYVLKGISSKNN